MVSLKASPLTIAEADMSLATVLEALREHDDKTLNISYADRSVQAGYHVTEVKAGSFVTLDCGANADAWQETILQVEDIPSRDDRPQMTVRTFRGILGKVDSKVRLNAEARLTFEIGKPDEPMRVFDVAGIQISDGTALLELGPREAICKPRHRAQQDQQAVCCSPNTGGKSCC
jgi:hypothetical protein